ncbi:hypothetical protein BC835DRAFT_498771 [Cytidiella melzeri]|nr:hypothetical protein BC835DRAFT_498771 [Cytidiella melzeri]
MLTTAVNLPSRAFLLTWPDIQSRGSLYSDKTRSSYTKTVYVRDDPTVKISKGGCTSRLTIRSLDNIQSIAWKAFMTKPQVIIEFAVLPRTLKFRVFFKGKKLWRGCRRELRVLLLEVLARGGEYSISEASDITQIITVTFVLECWEEHGFPASVFYVAIDASVQTPLTSRTWKGRSSLRLVRQHLHCLWK